MPAKYRMNRKIMELLEEAMVQANILHENKHVQVDSSRLNHHTYALQHALTEAIELINNWKE